MGNFLTQYRTSRNRRRKKLSKALERQARKLRAKGIAVDIDSLRTEYLSQHRVASESDLEDDDIQIDVVGEDSDDDAPEDCSVRRDPDHHIGPTTGILNADTVADFGVGQHINRLTAVNNSEIHDRIVQHIVAADDRNTGNMSSVLPSNKNSCNRSNMLLNPFSIESLLYHRT